jgi:hypothetical protein
LTLILIPTTVSRILTSITGTEILGIKAWPVSILPW